jgi:AAA15 family ATPase/GTPase
MSEEVGNGTSGAGGTEVTPPLNSQIIEAVQRSTNFVFGLENDFQSHPSTGTALSSGAVIAYEKVAQAAAYALQDAVDYQRNMLSITGAAQGKAIAMIIAGVNVDNATKALAAATAAATDAIANVAAISTNIDAMLTGFPRT